MGFAVQVAAVGFGGAAAPLLEEEGYAGGVTLVAQIAGPGLGHGAGAGAAFAADDQPVDALQVEVGEGAEQGLGAYEADGGGHGAQVVDAEGVALGLHADAHPHVGRPWQVGGYGG